MFYNLVDVFFFIGGVLFWILGIFTLREYMRFKFKNDLFLALFFFSIGWILPIVIFFPFSSQTHPGISLAIGLGANLMLPFGQLFLSLFVDTTFDDETSLYSKILIFFVGFIEGIFLFNGEFSLIPKDSLYGSAYMVSFSSDVSQFVLTIGLLLIFLTYIRLLFVSLKNTQKQKKEGNYSKELRVVFVLMFFGGFFWVVLTSIKQFYTYYLLGIDIFVMSIFYFFMLRYYLKKRELLYFLPGKLTELIVVHKSGLHLFDYDFKNHQVIEKNASNESLNLNSQRNLLYAITQGLEIALSSHVGEDHLDRISYSHSEIMMNVTENLIWYLISESPCKKYEILLKYYSKEIEVVCEEDLAMMDQEIVFRSMKLEESVKKYFKNIS